MDQDFVSLILSQGILDEHVSLCELRQDVLLAVIPKFVVDQVLDVWMLRSVNISHSENMRDPVLLACFEGCCGCLT